MFSLLFLTALRLNLIVIVKTKYQTYMQIEFNTKNLANEACKSNFIQPMPGAHASLSKHLNIEFITNMSITRLYFIIGVKNQT